MGWGGEGYVTDSLPLSFLMLAAYSFSLFLYLGGVGRVMLQLPSPQGSFIVVYDFVMPAAYGFCSFLSLVGIKLCWHYL